MATYVLTIGGTDRTALLQPGWKTTQPQNAAGNFTFSIVSLDGSVVPAIDQAVVLTENGTPIFGGFVDQPLTHGLGGGQPGAFGVGSLAITTDVTALDWMAKPSRFVFSGTLAGGTLKSMLATLCTFYMQGITLNASQVNGPTLAAITFQGTTIDAILNQFTTNTGYLWTVDASQVLTMYTPGSITAPFNIAANDGHVIGDVTVQPNRTNYANTIYVFGTGAQGFAQDAGQASVHGIWSLVVQDASITDPTTATAAAAALLAQSLPIPQTVQYYTTTLGLVAGMTQTIDLPLRGVNDTFILTEIDADNTRGGNLVVRLVTAVEGIVFQPGWRATMATWGGSNSGITLPGIGMGGGASRYAYYLGGSGDAFVQSPTPTWVAAGPLLVQLNTVARLSTTAQVTAQIRAADAGVSVQARLYDYTLGAPATGTSAVITSTTWSTVTFTVTLNPGSDYFGLQLLPGAAGAGVAGVGYVE